MGIPEMEQRDPISNQTQIHMLPWYMEMCDHTNIWSICIIDEITSTAGACWLKNHRDWLESLSKESIWAKKVTNSSNKRKLNPESYLSKELICLKGCWANRFTLYVDHTVFFWFLLLFYCLYFFLFPHILHVKKVWT